jgi:hypothetical protein
MSSRRETRPRGQNRFQVNLSQLSQLQVELNRQRLCEMGNPLGNEREGDGEGEGEGGAGRAAGGVEGVVLVNAPSWSPTGEGEGRLLSQVRQEAARPNQDCE